MRLEPASLKLRAANRNLRGEGITVFIDGQATRAYMGETVAGVLLAEQMRVFRRTAQGAPRGMFCGMGICYDCLITVDTRPNVRACMTPVVDGMKILTGSNVSGEGDK
jgi:predicted molibdopterin-dependent oxidoreductase YjgC